MALPMLTQTELVDELADETGWTKGDVKNFLQALETVIHRNIQDARRVKIAGIQVEPKYKSKTKKRMGRNPRTGEAVEVAAKPASVVLKLKAVKPLTDVELPSVRAVQRSM